MKKCVKMHEENFRVLLKGIKVNLNEWKDIFCVDRMAQQQKPVWKVKVNESTEEEIKKMKTEINEVENRGK